MDDEPEEEKLRPIWPVLNLEVAKAFAAVSEAIDAARAAWERGELAVSPGGPLDAVDEAHERLWRSLVDEDAGRRSVEVHKGKEKSS